MNITKEQMRQFMRELEADLFVQAPEGPNEPDYLKAERKRTAQCFSAINALIGSSGEKENKEPGSGPVIFPSIVDKPTLGGPSSGPYEEEKITPLYGMEWVDSLLRACRAINADKPDHQKWIDEARAKLDVTAPSPGPSVEGIKPDPAHLIALKLNDPANFPAVTDKDIRFYIRGVPSAPLPKEVEEAMAEIDALLESQCHLCRIINPQHKDCTECLDMDGYRRGWAVIKSALQPKEVPLEAVLPGAVEEAMEKIITRLEGRDCSEEIVFIKAALQRYRELGIEVGEKP